MVVILSVGVDVAKGWEAEMGMVSGGLACFVHFMRCGDSFELLRAGGNTVLSKFSLFPLFSGLHIWVG